jgi:hypothetical protein
LLLLYAYLPRVRTAGLLVHGPMDGWVIHDSLNDGEEEEALHVNLLETLPCTIVVAAYSATRPFTGGKSLRASYRVYRSKDWNEVINSITEKPLARVTWLRVIFSVYLWHGNA